MKRQRSAKKIGEGLKISTPDQMLSRLPISLAQLNTGNNPGMLKNEIRQILYSLYRSKKLTKKIYKAWLILFKRWRQFLWILKILKRMNCIDLN